MTSSSDSLTASSVLSSNDHLGITAFHRQQVERDVRALMARHGLEANTDVAESLCKTIILAHQFRLLPKGHDAKSLAATLKDAISSAKNCAEHLKLEGLDAKVVSEGRYKLSRLLHEPGVAWMLRHANYDAYRTADKLSAGNVGPKTLTRLIRLLTEAKEATVKKKSGKPWELYTPLVRAGVIAYDRCENRKCEADSSDGRGDDCEDESGPNEKGPAYRFVRDLIKLASVGRSAVLANLDITDQALKDAVWRFRKETLSRLSQANSS